MSEQYTKYIYTWEHFLLPFLHLSVLQSNKYNHKYFIPITFSWIYERKRTFTNIANVSGILSHQLHIALRTSYFHQLFPLLIGLPFSFKLTGVISSSTFPTSTHRHFNPSLNTSTHTLNPQASLIQLSHSPINISSPPLIHTSAHRYTPHSTHTLNNPFPNPPI